MSEQTAYPLSWPLGWKRLGCRERSRFGSYWQKPSAAKARDYLMAELGRLRANRIVISTNLKLRNDGLPYSNLKEPDDSGAAVYFELKGKPRVVACDKYTTVGDNLYAIGKTIEATRAIERWGSVTVDQAFSGYAALPHKTEDSWYEVLGVSPNATIDEVKTAYRTKAQVAHPDKGGTSEDFTKIQHAYENARQCLAAA
jgi:hypothetical protein